MNTPPDLITIPCPLCGSNEFQNVYDDNPSRVVECKECRLVFFNPQPSMEYLQKFYSTPDGYLSSIEENLKAFEANPKGFEDTTNFILYKVHQYLPERAGQRLLDIGSAYGFFLLFAQKKGLEVMGLEISTETSRYARQHGVEVWDKSLMDAQLAEASFDIITMNNVLEHTLNPVLELEKAFSLLKPSGVLYVGVPNFDSFVSRIDGYAWKMKSWPNHLYYFTNQTLSRMLSKVGFEIREFFTFMGESNYEDDARILQERLLLSDEREIRQVAECLWSLGKGQELVMIAQKPKAPRQ